VCIFVCSDRGELRWCRGERERGRDTTHIATQKRSLRSPEVCIPPSKLSVKSTPTAVHVQSTFPRVDMAVTQPEMVTMNSVTYPVSFVGRDITNLPVGTRGSLREFF
jgi:hypothetical protein